MFLFPLGCHVRYLEQSILSLGFGKLSCIFTDILTIYLFCVSLAYLLILSLCSVFRSLSSFLHSVGDQTLPKYMPPNVSRFVSCFGMVSSMYFTLRMYTMTCHATWYQIRAAKISK